MKTFDSPILSAYNLAMWTRLLREIGSQLYFAKRRWSKLPLARNSDGKVLVHIGCGTTDSPEFINIDALSFEFSMGVIGTTIKCIEYLAELGPTVFNYSLGETMKLELPEHVDRSRIIEILENMPREKSTGGDIYAMRNS